LARPVDDCYSFVLVQTVQSDSSMTPILLLRYIMISMMML